MTTVGKIKALIAQREIGYLLVPEGVGQPKPVVKRRIDHLVVGEPAQLVGQGDVTDLTAPAFDQRHHQAVGRQLGHAIAYFALRQIGEPVRINAIDL